MRKSLVFFLILMFSISLYSSLIILGSSQANPPQSFSVDGSNFWLTYETQNGRTWTNPSYITNAWGSSQISSGPSNIQTSAIASDGSFTSSADFIVEGSSAFSTIYTDNSVFPNAVWHQLTVDLCDYDTCTAYLGFYTSNFGTTFNAVGSTQDSGGAHQIALHPSAKVDQYWFDTNYVNFGGYNSGDPLGTDWTPTLGANAATGLQGITLIPVLNTNLVGESVPVMDNGINIATIKPTQTISVRNNGIQYVDYSDSNILPYSDTFANNQGSATVQLSVTSSLLGVTLANSLTDLGHLNNLGAPYLINSPQYEGSPNAKVTSNKGAQHLESTGITLDLVPGIGVYQQNMDYLHGGVYPIVTSSILGDAVGTYNSQDYCYHQAVDQTFARTVGWHIDNVKMVITYDIDVTMVYNGNIQISASNKIPLGQIQGSLGDVIWDLATPNYTQTITLENTNLVWEIIIIVVAALALIIVVWIFLKKAELHTIKSAIGKND